MSSLPQSPPPRTLQPGQRSQVFVVDAASGQWRLVLETAEVLIEAPNWSLDGKALYLNGAGRLWALNFDTNKLKQVPLTGAPDLNNDHVLDTDGEHIYISCNDWNVYRAPLAGGPAQLITHSPPHDHLMHFLHGVSPDGKELAFIGLEPHESGDWGKARTNVFTVSTDGQAYTQLTEGSAPHDGSEYSPDGEWIYSNSERFDGHAQIARMRRDGSQVEQLTFNERVNWFPHLPLEGKYATYIAFPAGTAGHPADLWVDIMLVEDGQWSEARIVARVFGGQGSLNVNSWSPNGRSFAYVAYPVEQ